MPCSSRLKVSTIRSSTSSSGSSLSSVKSRSSENLPIEPKTILRKQVPPLNARWSITPSSSSARKAYVSTTSRSATSLSRRPLLRA